MSSSHQYDAIFSGVIGQDYEMLKLICPAAAEMSLLVGEAVQAYCNDNAAESWQILELGGGTGITTLAILSANDRVNVFSVDNEPNMQQQARKNLRDWAEQGRLRFSGDDALTALQKLETDSFDLMASAYTLHNFEQSYRRQVIAEIHRVLKHGGRFINGDRYGLDDVTAHTRMIQEEIAGYFRVLVELQRPDLLEHWIIHLFNDESENHVMRENAALQQLNEAGFKSLSLSNRMAVNALVTADKTA